MPVNDMKGGHQPGPAFGLERLDGPAQALAGEILE